MSLNEKIREKIEMRFGPVKTLTDCERLAEVISADVRDKLRAAGQQLYSYTISRNTLGRILGINDRPRIPQAKTMDVIARYLDYESGREMLHDLGETYDVSDFETVGGIDVKTLEKGDMVHIAYDPRRDLVMTYLGDNRFVVNESVNSKLQPGDELGIDQFKLNFELLASDVTRDNEIIGDYRTAKCGGLKIAEIINR